MKCKKAFLGTIVVALVIVSVGGCTSTSNQASPSVTVSPTPISTSPVTASTSATSTPASSPTSTPTPSPSGPPSIALTAPQMNARVESSAVVRGTAQNIGNGQPLWLAVYDYTATRYYPHEETLTVSSTGQWKTTAHFGSDGTYDIVVFAANDNANSQLQQYLRTGQNAGLTNLPAGSVELARVTVYKT